MRDLRQLDLEPDARFATRLEAALLDQLMAPPLDDHATNLEAPVPIDLEARPVAHVSRRPPLVPLLAGAAAVVAVVIAGLAIRDDDRVPGPTSLPATAGSGAVTFQIEQIVDGVASSFSDSARVWGPDVSTVTGDVTGSAEGITLANSNTTEHDGAEFVYSFLISDAVVPTCGSGQLLLAVVAEYFEVDGDFRRDDRDGRWSGTWEVVPYSGRSDLVGISGSGTLSGRLADPALTLEGSFGCDGSPVNPPTP
jgi:hypothetical protein